MEEPGGRVYVHDYVVTTKLNCFEHLAAEGAVVLARFVRREAGFEV